MFLHDASADRTTGIDLRSLTPASTASEHPGAHGTD